MSLFEVRGLTVAVRGDPWPILRDVTLEVEAGEVVGLVGESGSGKTLLSLAVADLLADALERRAGTVLVDGREFGGDTGSVRRTPRKRRSDVPETRSEPSAISMIFQDPRQALNPTMRVGRQIERVLRINQRLSPRDARGRALDMLGRVRIPGATAIARAYPHQLSGGMCQRVMIAMALACRPQVLIADEPTTALDVTVQAQIFALLEELVADTGCAVLFITHDLGAVAEMCDRVVVLYGGQVMESGPVAGVLERPCHPYTRYLVASAREESDPRVAERNADFSLGGCRFAHLCPHAFERCATVPPAAEIGPGHTAACWLGVEGRP